MRTYLIRRFLLMIPTLFGITLITFFIMKAAPGDTATLRAASAVQGETDPAVREQILREVRALYGDDQPLLVQYGTWLKRIITFDFGESRLYRRPVMDTILDALPVTLALNVISVFIIYLITVPWGVYSSTIVGKKLDVAVSTVLFLLYSIPSFWGAMMLVLFFASGIYFDWFPVTGIRSVGAESWPWWRQLADYARHFTLPVFCYVYGSLAFLSRFVRSTMLENLSADHVRTARAKGLSETAVLLHHAFRTGLIPIVTLLGYLLPGLIGGSVIIESIFSIPGLGRLGFDAILNYDYPLIMAITTISALLTLAGMLLSDFLYSVVDPRIRFDGERT
ncbi:MAG: ABC transporter permease [Deltaproteobacteria bacterium]|nr:ABC transporter permease [Deltaproteobacteria bacterium]